jgi:hypothetical protein
VRSEDIYNAWKEQKSRIEVSQGFSRAVMDRIYQYEQGKSRGLLRGYQLVELISARRLAKGAVVTTGAVVGFVRIMFVVYAFLAC